MAKIKRLVLGFLPNQRCDLKCEYCYISQLKAWDEPEKLRYPAEYISKCLSVKRLGGVSLINLTGQGETLLQPDIVDLIKALLEEGHYVEIVTNGTITGKINEILKIKKELLSRLFFKMSFHYKELNKLNIMDSFFKNARKIHEAGASFTIELMAYDGIEQDIQEIKRICEKEVGSYCHTTIGRDDSKKNKPLLSEHSESEYREIWESFNSKMTSFKLDVLGKKRKEFCYAGAWSLSVNLYTGEAQPCYWQPYNQNIFKNIKKPIKFTPVGHYCMQPYCINAHSHLTWGLIPELNTPYYYEMRDRKCKNGECWLNNDCRQFFASKLIESNNEYSKPKKVLHTIIYPFKVFGWSFRNIKFNIRRIKNYLKRQ